MMLLSLVVLPNFIGADTYDYGFSGTVDYWGGNVDTNAKKQSMMCLIFSGMEEIPEIKVLKLIIISGFL